jgi:hypothetical protein
VRVDTRPMLAGQRHLGAAAFAGGHGVTSSPWMISTNAR